MKKNYGLRWFKLGLFIVTSAIASDPARITGIDFRGTGDPSQIEIRASGPIQVNKTFNPEDKQIVLEIPGATLDKGLGRNIDTSSFDSQIALISPYQTAGDTPSVRIVIQMRSSVDGDLASSGSSAVLSVVKKGGTQSASADSRTSTSSQVVEDVSKSASTASCAQCESGSDMEHLVDSTRSKKFTGKPITLQVRDVDVQDVFNLISDASGFNVVVGADVAGKLTLSLTDVPWDQALDVVLQTLNLGADRRGNVLRIMTLTSLAQEKQLELAAKRASEAVAPRITRVFPINYAKLDTLKGTLTDLATVEQKTQQQTIAAQSAAVAGGVAARPAAQTLTEAPLVVVADERTNSIIVRGLPEYVDRARKIIEILDTQTPQVVIEGKVVEATENFSSSLGGGLGMVGTYNGPNNYGVSMNGTTPYGQLFGAGGTTSTANSFNVTSASTGGAGFGLTQLIGNNLLNVTLNVAESEGKVKLVSSPRAVVMNKQSATMLQSFPAVIDVSTVSNGTVTTTPTQISANLSLNVTPTVTSDGSVLMQLTLSRDVLQSFGSASTPVVASRNISTNVLVDSGNTLVMGGFYSDEQDSSDSGIPFFRKIPIIGLLFGTKTRTTTRSELLFFITPQIVNPKKAGISST